jgi:hypothetical protein
MSDQGIAKAHDYAEIAEPESKKRPVKLA